MSEKKDGGAAFPMPTKWEEPSGRVVELNGPEGMSLRDYVAARIMAGMTCTIPPQEPGEVLDGIIAQAARLAFAAADAFIAERDKAP